MERAQRMAGSAKQADNQMKMVSRAVAIVSDKRCPAKTLRTSTTNANDSRVLTMLFSSTAGAAPPTFVSSYTNFFI